MADKQGFLTKEGGSIKTWKKRWCVLKNGVLHYSKRQVRHFLFFLRRIVFVISHHSRSFSEADFLLILLPLP